MCSGDQLVEKQELTKTTPCAMFQSGQQSLFAELQDTLVVLLQVSFFNVF